MSDSFTYEMSYLICIRVGSHFAPAPMAEKTCKPASMSVLLYGESTYLDLIVMTILEQISLGRNIINSIYSDSTKSSS